MAGLSKWFYIIFILALLSILVFGPNYIVNATTQGKVFKNVQEIPKNKVGLLLGTSKFKDKAKKIVNPYYQNRIIAAVELYMAGKIDYIIVSGDNSTIYYNEPVLMRDDLIAMGVPPNKIYMDNAGFRTLDSILRCRDIFGQNKFTIISQEFHNQRAVYIATQKGLSVVAYNAADGDAFFTVQFREIMARVKMMLDILINRQAKFYGEKIEIK